MSIILIYGLQKPYFIHTIHFDGSRSDYTKVGIREVAIQNNQFYINGQSIKLRGTNYHDSHPETGYVMTESHFKKT